MSNILTVEEAAAMLKIPLPSLYRYLSKGILGVQKIGKHWRIPEQVIIDYLSGKSQNGTATQATDKKEATCSLNEMEHGTSILSHRTANAYATLLGQKTSAKRKSTTTASKRSIGEKIH